MRERNKGVGSDLVLSRGVNGGSEANEKERKKVESVEAGSGEKKRESKGHFYRNPPPAGKETRSPVSLKPIGRLLTDRPI
jgi:hypothetical protein